MFKKTNLLLLLISPFLIGYGAWAWAIVIRKIWEWFMVTTWHLEPISFAQAVAISVCVGLFSSRTAFKIDHNSNLWAMMLPAILLPWLFLGVNGLIYLLFI